MVEWAGVERSYGDGQGCAAGVRLMCMGMVSVVYNCRNGAREVLTLPSYPGFSSRATRKRLVGPGI
jgi:hypothetical protein